MPHLPPAPVQFEFVCGSDMLEGPVTAMRDVLKLVNQLAHTRGARRPPTAWQSCDGQGRALRGGSSRSGPRRAVADVIVVPGWLARSGPHLNQLVRRDAAIAPRLAKVHGCGGQVLAFYTGVAAMGEAQLLEQRRAVVPWPFIPSVLRHAPRLLLAEGDAWTEDERLWTADSPSLACDLALRVLQACGLDDLAMAGRTVLLHSPERQRLAKAVAQDSASRVGPGALERARRWLEEHLHEPYSLQAAARAAAVSERSLLRHFKAAFGQTPLQALHAMRITRARMLLETSYLPVETIAERCGWRDSVMLREVFRRHTGQTPAAYRDRHRLRTERRRWGEDLPG
jgi:transcriptional regulator GlxA family with amidase domain